MKIKTNLFEGDRVKMTALGLATHAGSIVARHPDRVGTIVTDTTDPEATRIQVRWDGQKEPSEYRTFLPEELRLFEEEFEEVSHPRA